MITSSFHLIVFGETIQRLRFKHILCQVHDLTTELITRGIAAEDTPESHQQNFSYNPDFGHVALVLNIKAEESQRK